MRISFLLNHKLLYLLYKMWISKTLDSKAQQPKGE